MVVYERALRGHRGFGCTPELVRLQLVSRQDAPFTFFLLDSHLNNNDNSLTFNIIKLVRIILVLGLKQLSELTLGI